MNTRQKLEQYREARARYVADCCAQYGYAPRTQVRVIGSSTRAGFISAMFGCAFMIAMYATFDLGKVADVVRSAEQVSFHDLVDFIIYNFVG